MKASLRQRLFNAAHAIGYTVVPNWRADSYPQTVYLQRLFALLKIDCVLDVGANRGQYRDFLRNDVGFEGHIVSFEPLPDHVDAMRARAGTDAKWTIVGCALGARRGQAQFNVMASSTFSSFREPKDCGIDGFRDSNQVTQRIDVAIETLDEVLPDLLEAAQARQVYLKLDTQGYDLEVIRGATASLECVRALQTEASVRPIYEGMPDFPTVLEELRSRNFEPSGIYPNNAGHFPFLVEFDFHMIQASHRAAIDTLT